MKTADVVIGANWGDEGKGLMTDFLASSYGEDALVVRFCGGAQAGHTVTTPDGKRHVFNHIGSGSFCGSPTYLSRFFVCNPILFLAEAKRLSAYSIRPKVFVDPASPITTPYDMMINQLAEELRGAKRHGSCGVGFGETVERQQHTAYALCFADLYNTPKLRAKLELIRTEWVRVRLNKLGFAKIPQEWEARILAPGVLTHFIQDVEAFLNSVRPATVSVIARAQHVIFEGSQGLLLDQDHEWFPHVTRSNTGLKNVVSLAKEAELDWLIPYYVSRCYATRHGAGPMPHELPQKPYKKIVDLTNVPNPHQGTLRFGWLDLDLLQKTIRHDMSFAKGSVNTTPRLALTCLDQIDEQPRFISNSQKCLATVDDFMTVARTVIPAPIMLASYGPTRSTIKKIVRTTLSPVRDYETPYNIKDASVLNMSASLAYSGV